MKNLVLAAVACCCLGLTGCGGDDAPAASSDASSETVATTLNKDELIEQGDKICTRSNAKIDAANDHFINPDNPTEAEFRVAVTDVVIPELKGQVKDLRALKAPAEDAATITSMLDALEADVAKLDTDPLALLDEKTFADANKIATDYGFQVCGAS